MGIDLHWESEQGESLGALSDSSSLVRRFLPSFDSRDFPLLRYVDPAGDTIFNQLQIPDVVFELERLLQKRLDPKVKQHLQAVLEFIRQAQGQVHTYIKFYGD